MLSSGVSLGPMNVEHPLTSENKNLRDAVRPSRNKTGGKSRFPNADFWKFRPVPCVGLCISAFAGLSYCQSRTGLARVYGSVCVCAHALIFVQGTCLPVDN